MPREPELLSIAESIADGTAVDWEIAETHATAEDRPVVQQLRIIADLAGLHRSLAVDSDDRPPIAASGAAVPAIGRWGQLALLERLGGGTFGEVHRAWDGELERDVALKLLRGEASEDDPRASRIAIEGRLLARVRHPNVISVHGAAVNDGRIGLWMELVRGATLEQLLQQRGPFSAREAALIGIDLCRALAAIHAAGLIHRDVKAQNVMREDGGRIVLMDLGTGRESGATGTHPLADLAGTPLYLAPEIFEGAPASVRTDIYSLGVLLYRLVTGSFPVRAASLEELRAAHARGGGTRLRDARADLPTGFVRVVDRAIARDPDTRHASAGALEADLVQSLDDSAAPSSVDPAGRPRAAFPWRATLLAAAIVAVVGLAALLWPIDSGETTATGAAPIRSVAVLPLVNLSGDPSQEYFADGMTDEIISTLGRVDGLNVISRTSIMRFKNSMTPLSEITKKLNVGAVLEGSVLVVPASPGAPDAARRVRINARLLRAGSETQLWNRTFEQNLTDVLRLQSDIARAVADAVDVQLTRQQQSRLERAGAAGGGPGAQHQNPDVFDLYLKGRYHWNMRTREGLNRSVQYFREAIDRDPGFARAHAGLADAYSLLAVYGIVAHAEASAQADAAARKALELDPSLAEAHASLALVHMERLEWDQATTSFQRAVQLNPGYASAHHWYGAFLARRGEFAEAFTEIGRARELDPLSAAVSSEYGAILVLARRYDEAVAHLEGVSRLDPDLARNHLVLAEAYAHKGDYPRALAETEKTAALGGTGIELSADIGYILALSGRRTEALEIAEELAERYRAKQHGAGCAVATVYAGLRQPDRVFEWLDRARGRLDNCFADLKVDPRFDAVRNDPRMDALLAAIGVFP